MKKGIYFVTGIDTNIGKSYATGFLAKQLMSKNISVTTQKLVQTGNIGYSEDILLHRAIMEIAPTASDQEKISAPQIFDYPASPHLAAQMQNTQIDIEKITHATRLLAQRYDVVLLEGAGGILVPLSKSLLTIDYILQHNYPCIVVTSGRLGSINHTLLTLQALQSRHIPIEAVVFNHYPPCDALISKETILYLKEYMQQYIPTAQWVELNEIVLPFFVS